MCLFPSPKAVLKLVLETRLDWFHWCFDALNRQKIRRPGPKLFRNAKKPGGTAGRRKANYPSPRE
jgi:hypothetical protein